MKKIIFSFLSLFLITVIQAQQVFDTVYVQAGYSHQSYYSLSNDEVANIDNSDWDLAFESTPFGVAIRINGQIGTELFAYPDGDTSDWADLTDTTGLSSWSQLYDSDNSWAVGAFNQNADTSSMFDYGWGVYNPVTHHVIGDSIFVIKLSDNTYKKILIESMILNVYTFRYADLDNTNDTTVSFSKSSYSEKNFGYYSIQNEEEIDREPASDTWDIIFTKYVGTYLPGIYYPVTGGLANKGVTSAQADDVTVEDAIWSDYTMEDTISIIGWDWKSLNFTTLLYEIAENRCYFITDVEGNIWKLTFTSFSGSATGEITFTKEQVGTVGINEISHVKEFTLYPNPSTNGRVNIHFNNTSSKVFTTITDLSGKRVFAENFYNQGDQIQQLDVSALKKGLYIISIENESSRMSKKLIIK